MKPRSSTLLQTNRLLLLVPRCLPRSHQGRFDLRNLLNRLRHLSHRLSSHQISGISERTRGQGPFSPFISLFAAFVLQVTTHDSKNELSNKFLSSVGGSNRRASSLKTLIILHKNEQICCISQAATTTPCRPCNNAWSLSLMVERNLTSITRTPDQEKTKGPTASIIDKH